MIKREEAQKIIENAKLRFISLGGSSVELVDVENDNLKLKLNCPNGSTMFKVAGKKVTMEDEVKKEVEKIIKNNLKNANIIFV